MSMLNERTMSMMSVSRLRRTFDRRLLKETRVVPVAVVTVETALLLLLWWRWWWWWWWWFGEDLSEVIMRDDEHLSVPRVESAPLLTILLPPPPPPFPITPPLLCWWWWWWFNIVVAVKFEVVATDKLALLFVVPMDGVVESLLRSEWWSVQLRGWIEENVGGIRNEFDNCFRSFSPLWLKHFVEKRRKKKRLETLLAHLNSKVS